MDSSRSTLPKGKGRSMPAPACGQHCLPSHLEGAGGLAQLCDAEKPKRAHGAWVRTLITSEYIRYGLGEKLLIIFTFSTWSTMSTFLEMCTQLRSPGRSLVVPHWKGWPLRLPGQLCALPGAHSMPTERLGAEHLLRRQWCMLRTTSCLGLRKQHLMLVSTFPQLPLEGGETGVIHHVSLKEA